MLVIIHDLILLQYWEYPRPGELEQHCHRLNHTRRFCRGIIVNLRCTESALREHATKTKRLVPQVLFALLD